MAPETATSLPHTLGGLHAHARRRLAALGLEEAALEARLIVEHVTGTDRTQALSHPERVVPTDILAALETALARRARGEPVHRIIGRRDFHGVTLTLSPETLDPRPDTEALVDLVLPGLREIAARKGECRILDLGTGTGAIALALLRELPTARALGTDIQPGALEMARANADLNELTDRFETRLSDWFERVQGRFHAIVANPPYIRSNDIETLPREVREHDPRQALDGGADGLDAYRRIARGAAAHLEPDGVIAVEIGWDQARDVAGLFLADGLSLVELARDLAGHDRALMFSENAVQKGLGNRIDCR